MEKDDAGASVALPQRGSPSKRGHKSRPKAREKRTAQANPPTKKIVSKPSAQSDEEDEEPEPTLVHRKQKLFDQATPQVSGSILGVFSFVMGLAFDLGVFCFAKKVPV